MPISNLKKVLGSGLNLDIYSWWKLKSKAFMLAQQSKYKKSYKRTITVLHSYTILSYFMIKLMTKAEKWCVQPLTPFRKNDLGFQGRIFALQKCPHLFSFWNWSRSLRSSSYEKYFVAVSLHTCYDCILICYLLL